MADMIYNGVELPDIDAAWTNQSKYPYAAITFAYSSDGLYELWLSSAPFLVRTYSGSEAISLFAPESYNVDYQRWRVLIGDWALMDSSTVWANNTLNGEGNLVYATYDVYDTAENLYLAGSTHTGGSGGDGGDTGGGGDGGDTHTHSFIPTTIDPTCTESGYVIYECDCGSSYRGDDIPATGHQWDGNTCTVCGVTRTVRNSSVIDFFAGLMMGQRIKKIKNAVATATQYLYGTPSNGVKYNGVELPDIESVWTDKETHPYATIVYTADGTTIVMFADFEQQAIGGALYTKTAGNFVMYSMQDNAWVYITGGEVAALYQITDTGTILRWTSHDILNADGSVYLAASEPVHSGNIGLRNGESVTYYDGAVLPPLPEWDKTVYPYAFVTDKYLDNGYVLYVSSEAIVAHENWMDTGNTMLRFNGTVTQYMSWKIVDDGVWNEHLTGELNGEKVPNGSLTNGTVRWTNYDMQNADGAVYHAKSEPIPVTGVVAYSYGGVVLSPFPETAYQYALLGQYNGNHLIMLTSQPISKGIVYTIPTGSEGISYALDADSNKWEMVDKWGADGSPFGFPTSATWANYDVLSSNGSVYLAASDAIPVYE